MRCIIGGNSKAAVKYHYSYSFFTYQLSGGELKGSLSRMKAPLAGRSVSNQSWGIGVFTKGGGYLKGGIDFERGGSYPSAHYGGRTKCFPKY